MKLRYYIIASLFALGFAFTFPLVQAYHTPNISYGETLKNMAGDIYLAVQNTTNQNVAPFLARIAVEPRELLSSTLASAEKALAREYVIVGTAPSQQAQAENSAGSFTSKKESIEPELATSTSSAKNATTTEEKLSAPITPKEPEPKKAINDGVSAKAPAEQQQKAPAPPTPKPPIAQEVVDGDTIILSDGRTVHYLGINAPELTGTEKDTCFSEEAIRQNQGLIQGKEVRLEDVKGENSDPKNIIAHVWTGGKLAGEILVDGGFARTTEEAHSRSELFSALEQSAKAEERGLWATCIKPNPEDMLPLTINEVRVSGGEFVEIYNPHDSIVELHNYFLAYYDRNVGSWSNPSAVWELPKDELIGMGGESHPRRFFTAGFGSAGDKMDWSASENEELSNVAGTVAIWAGNPKENNSIRGDAVGWGGARLFEQSPTVMFDEEGSIIRRLTGYDHDNNKDDFRFTTMETPGEENRSRRPENIIRAALNRNKQDDSSLANITNSISANSVEQNINETEDSNGNTGENQNQSLLSSSKTKTEPEPLVNAQNPLVAITEIMYNPPGGDMHHEWIEVKNISNQPLELGHAGWTLRVDKNDLPINHAWGPRSLEAGQVALVILNRVDKFAKDFPAYGSTSNIPIYYTPNLYTTLDNDSGNLTLIYSRSIHDQLAYQSSIGAQDDGNSLQLVGGNWIAASPTPGTESSGVSARNLLNTLVAHMSKLLL